MERTVKHEIHRYIENHKEELISLIAKLCTICSPTGFEKAKAEYILGWLHSAGAGEAYCDEAGNVLFLLRGETSGKLPLYCAHIDTVFGDIEKICPRIEANKMYAPSCGDNCANAAGLMFIIKMFLELSINPPSDILFAFNVGEEGLGNLKGIRHIMSQWHSRIDEVIAVDGGCDAFVNRAVGSKRYNVQIETQGGHSWSDFGKDNAIVLASCIINQIYQYTPSFEAKTTYNIGTIKGGTSVNTIAGSAEFLLDLRSESAECLEALDKSILEIIRGIKKKDGSKIKLTLLGIRPCGEAAPKTELEKRLLIVRAAEGLETSFHCSSTDANIPLSMGIPAVSFGMRRGGKAHSIHEYIELDSLVEGMRQFVSFMLS